MKRAKNNHCASVFFAVSILACCSAMGMSETDLHAAIAAAEDGETIIVPNEIVINTPPLTFTKSVTLKCEGERFKLRRGPWDSDFVSVSGGASVRFENIIFDGRMTRGRFASMSEGTLTLGAGTTVSSFMGAYHVGGFNLSGTARLVMEEGAEITEFTTTSSGTAVQLNGSSVFEMKGGVIHNCSGQGTEDSRYTDRLIDVNSANSVFSMSGGLITGNTSANGCAGVFAYSGTVNLSGTATITNNVCLNGKYANDLTVWKDQQDKVDGRIIVATDWTGWATFWTSYTPALSGNWYWPRGVYLPVKGNVPGVGGRIRSQMEPSLTMNANRGNDEYFYWMAPEGEFDGVPISNHTEARDLAAKTPNVPHVWGLARDYSLDAVTQSQFQLATWCRNLTIKSMAGTLHKIRYGADSPIYTLDSADYTLRFENVILQGNRDIQGAGTSPLIQVESGRVELGDGAVLENAALGIVLRSYGATARMEKGAEIRNCRSKLDNASAVSVGYWNTGVVQDDSPMFTMEGGVISNCTITVGGTAEQGYGGAIFVRRATFVMTGGVITGNTSDKGVAGLLNWADSTVRFGGTARIEGNVGAKDDVYLPIAGGSTVAMTGDFRGRIGISNDSQEEGEFFCVKKDPGASGANGFFPSGTGAGSGLIGVTDPSDAARLVWGRPVSMLDNVWYGSVADMVERLPKTIDLADAGQVAKLPYVCGGQLGGTVQVACTRDDLGAVVALFDFSTEGKSGNIAFELPAEFAARYTVRNIDSKYCLSPRPGLAICIR